eukprot:scaffold551177_cov15-Prasinocladus_malaysianus.AAC.1
MDEPLARHSVLVRSGPYGTVPLLIRADQLFRRSTRARMVGRRRHESQQVVTRHSSVTGVIVIISR